MMKIAVKTGCKYFEAEIYRNDASKKFLRMLPLSVKLEKDAPGYFSPIAEGERLTGRIRKHRNFTPGDIAICNGISVSIFVEQFTPKEHFIKVGHIRNPEILESMFEKNEGFVTFDFIDE